MSVGDSVPAPAFAMLGDQDAAVCVDGVCAVPPRLLDEATAAPTEAAPTEAAAPAGADDVR